ncbi:MAG: class I SAM-dependent methyltransferase [Microthrixaceae bacterium]
MSDYSMSDSARRAAEAARGFMPPDEGLALFDAAMTAAKLNPQKPFIEIGSYCGRSSIYLGEAARQSDTVLFAVDHHRGSEENQPGWEWHEPDLVDEDTGRMDTLPWFRRAVFHAGLEPWVIAVVGDSPTSGRWLDMDFGFVFIDGGHGVEPAALDYRTWTPKVVPGGILAIHDVFTDPALGGQAPYEQIYLPAVESGRFEPVAVTGSLRTLRRIA